MTDLIISIDDEQKKILEKRAKKNLMTLKEQIENIVRRSCVNANKNYVPKDSCDDKLVKLFSKQNKGRKKKKEVKNEKKK